MSMSEEQNLFEAAAPPPPRAKRQTKPKKAAALPGESGEIAQSSDGSRDGSDASRSAEERGSRSERPLLESAGESPRKRPASRKSETPRSAADAGSPAGDNMPSVEQAQGSGEPARRVSDEARQQDESPRPTVDTPREESSHGMRERRPWQHGNQAVASQSAETHAGEGQEAGGAGAGARGEQHDASVRDTGERNAETAVGTDSSTAGMSQSRRRRRKRKNRAAANAAAHAGTQEGAHVGAMEALGETAVAGETPMREFRQGHPNTGEGSVPGGQGFSVPRVVGQGFQSGASNGQGGQANQGQGGQGQGQNSRRNKKKKFRRAGEGSDGQTGVQGGFQSNGGGGFVRPPRPEPGNSLQGSTSGMGQRRNRKQGGGFGSQGGGQNRGPRTFVGPMDHSYREANGNFADVPASTIQMGNGRHRNNGHRQFNEDRLPPELMHNKRPVAIPDDAPTHIYFFIEDLFFTAKIQEAAKQQGVKVAFMKPDKDIVAHLSELHDHEHPSLIVFDLNNAAAKPLTLIPKLKNKLKKGTSIVGFLSHLQGDLKAKAVEAGCNSVMPRAAFSQNLPNLLRRYGVEDEHEPNFNQ